MCQKMANPTIKVNTTTLSGRESARAHETAFVVSRRHIRRECDLETERGEQCPEGSNAGVWVMRVPIKHVAHLPG